MTRATPERGAALLVSLVAIAVLTALAVSLAYDARVSLRIAANARDELRASYLARSGVALSRLVLSFQREIDDLPQPAAGAPQGMSMPRVQLWRLLPVGTELARSLFPPRSAAPAAAGEGALPESGFQASIDDEGRKINVQLDGGFQGNSGPKMGAQILGIYQLVCDARWDPLFEREDARGNRTSRDDLITRLRDWVDTDEQGAALRAAAGGTSSCSFVPDTIPLEAGYGDENQPYDRGEDRYKVKNARFDSLDELFLVAGVDDAFMAAFGDAVTVYLRPDAKQNVNELDPAKLVAIAARMAEPPGQPALLDPVFAERLHKLVVERTLNGILGIDAAALGQLVMAAGVAVNQNLLAVTNVNSPFTDRSDTFRVRAIGKAGDVATTIDAVVRTKKAAPGQPVAAPGQLVHWQEE